MYGGGHFNPGGYYLDWKLVSTSSKRSILGHIRIGLVANATCQNIFLIIWICVLKGVGIDLTLCRIFLHVMYDIVYIY